MPQPPEVEQLSASLRAMYQRAWQDIQARQDAVADDLLLRKPQRIARLREMQDGIRRAMADADEQARAFITGDLPRAYALGATSAGGQFTWSGPHVDAATILARDTYDDLLRASATVNRTARKFVKEAAQVAVERAVVGGDTAVAAARAAANRLIAEHGIFAVLYKDGSRHGIAEYTEMAVRTKSAAAYVEGSFNQMGQLGIAYCECFDGPSCSLLTHDSGPLANGLVMTVEEARQYPLSHPRCQRSWSPRPDVTNRIEAKQARSTSTPAQREDAARAEIARKVARDARPVRPARAGTRPRGRTRPANTRPTSVRRAAQRAVDDARVAEPRLTQLVDDLAGKYGGTAEGIQYRLKGVDSLARKIEGDIADAAAKGRTLTPNEVAAQLFDVNRYTMRFPTAQYAQRSQATLDRLRADGHTLKVKNFWNNTKNPYQGINVQVITPEGRQFELQFHTAKSLRVKEGELHHLFALRRVEPNEAVRDALNRQMFEVAAKIPMPPNVAGVG